MTITVVIIRNSLKANPLGKLLKGESADGFFLISMGANLIFF